MFKNLLLTVMVSACVATATAGVSAVGGNTDTSSRQHRGVKLTPEQVRVVEAVSGVSRNYSLPVSGSGKLKKLSAGTTSLKSPLKVNPSGSKIQGWRISDEFGSMPSGWYELNLDGSENLLWEYHDPNWVDDGWGDEPKFPFNSGFYKDDRVFGFHGEMLFNWLLWGYGSFNLNGDILEYHEYGEDLSVTDFSTYVISCVYDENAAKAYAYTLNSDASGYMLQSIDLNTCTFSPIVNQVAIDNICIGLAYNPQDKAVYGFTPDSRFVTLNSTTGELITVKKLDFPATTSLKGMTYSPYDKAFVFVFCDGREDSKLYLIKPDGELTYLAVLPDALQYNILVTPDKMVDDRTPLAPRLTGIDFPGGSLDGTVSVTMPVLTFGGQNLSGELSLQTYLDGTLYTETAASAGQTLNVSVTGVQEGLHTFSFSVKSGTLESARIEHTTYVGYDTPKAPTDINLSEGILSWNPVTEGEHGGYIETENLTYNIYLNGTKINETPVSGTSYSFSMPEEVYRKYVAQVEADNHGHVSQRGFSNDIKSGVAFPLPFFMQPTVAEGELIQVFSERGSWYEWRVSQDVDSPGIYCSTSDYGESQEEWFILPAINVPQSDKLIEISFDVMIEESYSDDINENISVAYGKEREPSAMTVIKSWEGIDNVGEWKTLTAWCLPAQGDTFFGFMTRTHEDGEDLKVRNIRLSVSGRSAMTPSEVSGLTATALPNGVLKAKVEFRMPDKSAAGLSLDGRMLTATVTTDNKTVSVTGRAGSMQAVEINTVQGWNVITVTAANENLGLDSSVKVFTGMDIPRPIEGIAISHGSDYKSLHLEWKAPSEGYNGGYINPADVEYALYTFNEDIYEWEFAKDLGAATQYDFTPQGLEGLALVSGAILTSNAQGSCGMVLTFESPAGVPYALPMIEDFNDDEHWGPLYEPCTLERPDDSYTREWMFINGAYPYQIPQPTPYGAGAYCVFGEDGDKARVSLPVFSTKDVESVGIELPIWCGPEASAINVYAEAYGVAPELIGVFSDPSAQAWRKHRFHLPSKFIGKDWVSVKIDAVFSEGNTVGAFADYRIKTFLQNDLCITSLNAPSFATVGDDVVIRANIENTGTESALMPEMVLEIYKDDKLLETIPMTPAESKASLEELEQMDFFAYWKPDGNACGEIALSVKCVAKDMDELNNVMNTKCMIATGNQPVVADLRAIAGDGTVVLDWTEPEAENGKEGFENFSSFYFSDKIGDFKNLNRDEMNSGYFAAFRFPFDDAVKGWQVIGEKEMTELMSDVDMENKYLHAYSGNNVIAAFAALSFTGADPASDRWLVSPRIKGGSDVKFMLTSGWEGYQEKVEVLYSTTDDNPENFVNLDNILLLSSQWKEYSYTLPENACYFAIVYRGESPDGFFVMVDDIVYEPVDKGFTIVGYDILRDGVAICDNVIAHGNWTDNYILPENGAVYNVVPVVERDGDIVRGCKSNDAIAGISGIGDAMIADIMVKVGHGCISISGCENQDIMVYTIDGRTAATISHAGKEETLQLEAGFYIVRVGSHSRSVVVSL